MIIKRLTMHNFGVYAGTNEFNFEGQKPIVLIGGLNGRGKTTFLEAVLLSLYGPNSFAYQESTYKSYGQYLRSFVNRNDCSKQCYIELEFQMNTNDSEVYLIHREWDALGKRTKESIAVKKDGKYSEFLTNNWPMFIENLLPSALSNFFFFDGEKIAELVVDDTDEQMKNSIRAMLGLNTLDVLNNDLKRIINKLTKKASNNADIKHVDSLRDQKEAAEKKLATIDEELLSMTSELNDVVAELEKARVDYTAMGGGAIEQRQEMLKKKATIMTLIEKGNEQMINLAASELPLTLVYGLIRKINEQSFDESDKKISLEAAKTAQRIYQEYDQKKHSNSIDGFLEYMEKVLQDNDTEMIYNLSDSTMYQVEDLVSLRFTDAKDKLANLLDEQDKIQKEADQIESYLSVDINEKSIQEAYKKIKKLEQKKIDCEVKISSLEERRKSANGEAIRTGAEFKKAVEKMLGTLEAADDAEREIKYAHLAQNLLAQYATRLQLKKVNQLATTITECYRLLANKKTLIDHIEMDSTDLSLMYLDKNVTSVPKEKLSAGEKQLMVISILWALAKCSKKKLPVIIDTPLSRLDSAHRKSLITTYFPNASEQTIILSTDTEIDDRYYKLMKKDVGDEFYLNYNENTKSTSIEKGYFKEEKLA